MTFFVWTKMQAAAGETLEQILVRKETERLHGNGNFWWGIGTSLGEAVEHVAASTSQPLSVLFSKQLSAPKQKDVAPPAVCAWNSWISKSGSRGKIPDHVLITGGTTPTDRYYALVCYSETQIGLFDHGPFDPALCQTRAGKTPGASQVTCLLEQRVGRPHPSGQYRLGFESSLVRPLSVKLTDGRVLNSSEVSAVRSFRKGGDWARLVKDIRRL